MSTKPAHAVTTTLVAIVSFSLLTDGCATQPPAPRVCERHASAAPEKHGTELGMCPIDLPSPDAQPVVEIDGFPVANPDADSGDAG